MNANLLKEIVPDFLLPLRFPERLLDQLRVELRLAFLTFPILHFPKASLKRPRGGQRLAKFMTPANTNETSMRKCILQ